MTEQSSFIVQGSVSSVAVAFLQAAVLRMIPYAVPAVALIALDLLYGVKAAKYRGEDVRFSTAISRTVTKTFSYICWIILASTLSLAFSKEWIEWFVLGLVYVNELVSIFGNYLETKGVRLSLENVYKWMLKIVFKKTLHEEITNEEADELFKEGKDAIRGIVKDATSPFFTKDRKGRRPVKKEDKKK